MTRRGEASRALSLAYSASFLGGCFSILSALIALFVFGPYLRDLGALFGQRDIMMAAILGAVLLIAAHRQTMGLAAMLFGFGFLIAMIGRQSTRQIDRYTFDIEYLYSGFNLIVVIVGIFALSQALNLMVGKDDDPPEARITGGLLTGFKELASNKVTALCSACYGTVMGIIPGVGEFVAQFFSYSTARALSKEPERFGHGSSAGLVASETSNNAVPAAAMIPLLALGVPGEALTAMMMVVFFDAGIKPGPDIFENSPDFLFSLFTALLIINVLVLITLLFSTKYIARMIHIPNRFLGAFIMILSFVGVYSIRNSLVDCIFAVVFGFIGYALIFKTDHSTIWRFSMKKIAAAAALAATTVFGGVMPATADYPESPVQFIVPWPPGDFEDILTRMIAADFQEKTGVSASVVNRPGGGDGPFPGALEVLDGPTDGSVVGSFVIGVPVVGPKIDIGIEEDSFTPVGIFLTATRCHPEMPMSSTPRWH